METNTTKQQIIDELSELSIEKLQYLQKMAKKLKVIKTFSPYTPKYSERKKEIISTYNEILQSVWDKKQCSI